MRACPHRSDGLFRQIALRVWRESAVGPGLGEGVAPCHIPGMKLFKSHRPDSRAPARPKSRPGPAGESAAAAPATPDEAAAKERELGGPGGPEPTRYGDWERKGICYDF